MKLVRITYSHPHEGIQLVGKSDKRARSVLQPLAGFNETVTLEGADVGDRYVFEVIEMSKTEFDKLPEFSVFGLK